MPPAAIFTGSARQTVFITGDRSILECMDIVFAVALSVGLIAGLLIGLEELLSRQPR
jgi:hypothetical protein